MRKVLLAGLFIAVSHTCTAPAIDFRLRLKEFNSALEYTRTIYHENEFMRFINDLGHRESANNWTCINLIGCFGEWQFAESTLKYLGFGKVTLNKFRRNPQIFPRELQVKALKSLILVNLAYLREYEDYIGTTVRGIKVTKSGMIAAAHLGGAGSVKKFLSSGGRINKKDALGTSVGDYMHKFGGYDLRF